MTIDAAQWLVSTFLVVVITMAVLAWAIRPPVQQLRNERDAWRDRAMAAEGILGDQDRDAVRIINPGDNTDRDDIAIWLKGTE